MIEIQPMQLHEVEAVKRVIVAVCCEIWQVPEAVIRHYDDMSDIDEVQRHYFENNGTFLVLLDNSSVVGCGAIKRWSNDICELKRMWFLKDYRGRGLGTQMAKMLLSFARTTGYKFVRLDTTDEQKQAQAIKLYERLGFYSIKRYNDGPCTVFMEKKL